MYTVVKIKLIKSNRNNACNFIHPNIKAYFEKNNIVKKKKIFMLTGP